MMMRQQRETVPTPCPPPTHPPQGRVLKGVVVIVFDPSKRRVLTQLRPAAYFKNKSAVDMIELPGGHYERKKDKDARGAAARELLEETGLLVSHDQLISEIDVDQPGNSYMAVFTVVAPPAIVEAVPRYSQRQIEELRRTSEILAGGTWPKSHDVEVGGMGWVDMEVLRTNVNRWDMLYSQHVKDVAGSTSIKAIPLPQFFCDQPLIVKMETTNSPLCGITPEAIIRAPLRPYLNVPLLAWFRLFG